MTSVAVFDAYGTLLDVHSAMARHAARIGPDWARISQDWRTKQLEYAWVRSLAGPAHHRDFAALTDAALAFTLARHGIADDSLFADLRTAYRALHAYPEALPVLKSLRAAGHRTAILSNGEPGMLSEGVAAAGLSDALDAVLSVESVGVFKPAPPVYGLAVQTFGVAPADILFVSSNAWDAFGALEYGFTVAWVNRAAQPDEYGLRGRVREMRDLSPVADMFAA